MDDLQFRGSFLILRAELAIEEGRPREAWDDLEGALNLAATTDDAVATPQICALGVRALVDDAELSRRRGVRPEMDLEKVRLTVAGLVVEATSSIERAVGVGGSGSPRAATFALLCQAEASRLESSDPERWSETAGCWTDLSERYLVAYTRWREAEAVLNAGSDRGRATESLREAWRIAEELGAVPLRARIEQMGQRARIDMDPTKPEPTSDSLTRDLGITAREAEVLGHLAQGRTDAQIAGELFISKKTASVHVSNLIRKLNVSNRVTAGELGRSMGLGESSATYQSAV